jgi:hypothetical protein
VGHLVISYLLVDGPRNQLLGLVFTLDAYVYLRVIFVIVTCTEWLFVIAMSQGMSFFRN